MQIEEKNGNLILTKVKDFNIEQILECGQCFHFVKLKDMEYVTVAYDKALHIKQESDTVILYDTDMNDYNSVRKKYFDMDTDYGKIKKYLKENCKELTDAIREKSGIRILRQDFTETLLSFIISQNKQIPHIKQIVAGISKEYGRFAGVIEGQEFYSFPKLEELLRITEDDFRSLKTGFRAPYLCDAILHLNEWGEMESFADLSYEEAKNKLMTIKGVGDKVANCVLLFGLGYTSAFPVDVWIKRIMESIYFKEDTSKDKIMDYAKEGFGEYGGYAQQYLFYFARDGKIS